MSTSHPRSGSAAHKKVKPFHEGTVYIKVKQEYQENLTQEKTHRQQV